MHRCATLYGLKVSCWNPFQSINHPTEGLIAIIKKEGPLVVSGCFGQQWYRQPPFIMKEKIAKRDIFAWKSGVSLDRGASFLHSIVVIGGRKPDVGQEVVYYVDPCDPSDPDCMTRQKIYCISYKCLSENVCNLHASWSRYEDRECSSSGYAWKSPYLRAIK
jgi:hypothetical protein